DAVIKLFHEKGSDAWFTDKPEDYLGEACVCPKCGGHHLKAGKDILDVWWDSGVSWKAVCEFRDELQYPADMYLEGSDQHRGWFQSSLLTSLGANDIAPYKAVVSQGFTLDGQGRKMSKSLGNVIDPNKVCAEMGADILRLWVASTDTSHDVAVDHEILARTSDAYRRFRNTFRFLLGELEGQFDPEHDLVPVDEMERYDLLVLARACDMHEKVSEAYAGYRFYQVYRALYDFVVTELSNGYLNATKDRMYCDEPGSKSRRSAQTCWYYLLEMLLRDLQPILSFTTDEVMAHLPESARDGQTFAALLDWWSEPLSHDEVAKLLGEYNVLLEARGAYTKANEAALAVGTVSEKTSQATRCVLTLPAEQLELVRGSEAMLAEAFVCSEVELASGDELACEVLPAHGEKCPRCWNWRPLGADGLCCRCSHAVAAATKAE
ncbi:class I tRNA ligase family protein, partial [Parolsenella catena]|uniref:class I tRNA ligase family protein n=1 Tax=Parolsenella catena TaxID=2003188 RepID=UPI002FDE62FF